VLLSEVRKNGNNRTHFEGRRGAQQGVEQQKKKKDILDDVEEKGRKEKRFGGCGDHQACQYKYLHKHAHHYQVRSLAGKE
jgi:hypothetical protein